jgi:hypothetical protein
MPSLRAGVVKLATTVSARGKRKAGDNNDEHHRDQQDRRQQNGGHRIDSTPDTTVVTGLILQRRFRVVVCRRGAGSGRCGFGVVAGGATSTIGSRSRRKAVGCRTRAARSLRISPADSRIRPFRSVADPPFHPRRRCLRRRGWRQGTPLRPWPGVRGVPGSVVADLVVVEPASFLTAGKHSSMAQRAPRDPDHLPQWVAAGPVQR